MKKHLFTFVLMLVGMTAWAQSGSGWTDPSSNYQEQTAVYIAIDCGDYDMYYYSPDGYVNYNYTPEVAAFVDGELRQVVTEYQTAGDEYKTKIYTFRVGGTSAEDQDKEITFKIYDERSGLIYPLQVEGENTITWAGDNTSNDPSEFYTLSFTPATSVKLFTLEADIETEVTQISICVAEKKSLDSYYAKVYDAEGNETKVESKGAWDIQYNDNMPYIQKVETDDGTVVIEGMEETPVSEDTGENLYVQCAAYTIGSLYAPLKVQVLPQYFPVTSIAIDDVNYYWEGYGRLVLSDNNITYNNNESTPTNPGVKIISSSNEDVVSIASETGLTYNSIGTSEITVAAIDDESVTCTFTINILSGLEAIYMEGDPTYNYDRYSTGEEYLQLTTPLFTWIMNEDGSNVITNIDESYTISSSNPDIISIDETTDETGYSNIQVVSLKKGTATITYTSNYDPTKKAELKVVVTQMPSEVKITKIGAVEVTTSATHETTVNVSVGQEVTAIAQVDPTDADITSFVMEIIDADQIPFEADVVTIGEPNYNSETGCCELTFTFNSVPDRATYLKATVNDQLQDKVRLNIIQSVTSITVPESMTIWITEGNTSTGNIEVIIEPEDATNKSVTMTSSNESVVPVSDITDGYLFFEVLAKGTTTLTFTSDDNPSVSATCEITVKKKVTELIVEGFESTLYNDGNRVYPVVTFSPEDADYDVNALSASVENYGNDFVPEGWEFITLHNLGAIDGGVEFEMTGRSFTGYNYLPVVFSYDATIQGDESPIENIQEVCVSEKITFTPGWNWVSFISAGLSAYEMEGSLEEARSQYYMVIDDPSWGLFGDLSWMDQFEAYKINMKEDAKSYEFYPMEGSISEDGNIDDKVLERGWNWESYPYEYAYNVEDIFDATQFNEGDIILSKEEGFVTLTDGTWEGTLTTLTPQQGYLIKSNVESGEYSVTMPNRFSLEQGTFRTLEEAASRDRSVWHFDGSRFANTMGIIAKIDMLDDVKDYTIGAFVGNECRGEGKFVNGRAYINAVGEAGDVVTLRLHNSSTGEYTDLIGKVEFTDMAGSVKAPVVFTRSETTSVENTADDTLIVKGNIATAAGTIQVYNMQGKVVAEGFQRVNLSHLGQGVYMIKAGDQSRKVIK